MTAAPTSRRKTLIFHIGDHKTGSTSIQQAFAKQEVILQGHELFYPANLANNALANHCQTWRKGPTAEARQAAARQITKLADSVRASEADFVLISGEALENVSAALFREVIETFFKDSAQDIRIIAYVRPHAARITSSFAERIKIGTPQVLRSTLAEFASKKKSGKAFVYLPRFMAWRKHFGEAFTLRPMIRSELYQGDVVHDFVHHAFGGLPFTIADSDSANESLCLEDLMRLKVLQTNLAVPRVLALRVGWEFSRLLGHMPAPENRSKLALHKGLAKDTQRHYSADARAMDQAFFDGQPLLENELQRAVDKAVAKPVSTEPADYLSASELRSLDVMSAMVAGLLESEAENWPRFLHQKRIRDLKGKRPLRLFRGTGDAKSGLKSLLGRITGTKIKS